MELQTCYIYGWISCGSFCELGGFDKILRCTLTRGEVPSRLRGRPLIHTACFFFETPIIFRSERAYVILPLLRGAHGQIILQNVFRGSELFSADQACAGIFKRARVDHGPCPSVYFWRCSRLLNCNACSPGMPHQQLLAAVPDYRVNNGMTKAMYDIIPSPPLPAAGPGRRVGRERLPWTTTPSTRPGVSLCVLPQEARLFR